jgi:hypothetical protein
VIQGKKHTPEQIVATLHRIEQAEAVEAAGGALTSARRRSTAGNSSVLPAHDAAGARDEAVRRHVNPRRPRSGNGRWRVYLRRAPTLSPKERGIVVRFIEPGSPWQNGVNESCTGRFRDECLNRRLLESAQEAHGSARAFRHDFNHM